MPVYSSRPRPLVVVILDGWGISFVHEGNAIAAAKTPNMDSFVRYFPSAAIQAAGIEVGLPWGEMGNSETGHRNIGAGQVQYQVLPMIDKAIETKEFFQNKAFLDGVEHVKQHNSNLHLMGLLSPGGIHSHMNHLFALLELAAKEKLVDHVFIHLFTDGRDAPPQSAQLYLEALEEVMKKQGVGKIASVTGRFYAMDRNENWDRTAAAYSMLTGGSRRSGAPTAHEAIEQSYQQQVHDEMIVPTAITHGGQPLAPIKSGDAVIFFNFRPDRARQLMRAFVAPQLVGFTTTPLSDLYFATMAQYDRSIDVPIAFSEEKGEYPLARVLSEANLTQFHIAETEKYAHVTYYLNVGHEKRFPGEEWVLIPSSAAISFALEPQMQAKAITDRVIQELEQGLYDVYFINFANADMVGHTGNFEATVEACSFVDECLGRIYKQTAQVGGWMIVTADHGNAEDKINMQTGEIETEHTTNSVPFYLLAPPWMRTTPKSQAEISQILSTPIGVLADVAPTMLEILQLPKAPTMTGVSLLSSLR
jgi:2,3-bisphosphoglycerate-independent phosphoglycerate mutase